MLVLIGLFFYIAKEVKVKDEKFINILFDNEKKKEEIKEKVTDFYDFKKIKFRGSNFDVVKVDPSKVKVEFFWKNDQGQELTSIKGLNSWIESKNERLVFATNAGMFNEELSPIGLYIENGEKVKDINLNEGPGNFHLMPNGVFVVYDDKAEVVESSKFEENEDILFATQSGPMLVINNNIHKDFNEGSDNVYIRNGVGIDQNGDMIFVISNSLVNFYDFALLFKEKLNCPNALYLDGSISQMYIPDVGRKDVYGNLGAMIGIIEKQ